MHYCSARKALGPDTPTVTELGTGRRLLGSLVIVFGVGTFFWPAIATDPAVWGRSRWSAFDIADELYAGRLPHPASQGVGYVPPDLSITYAVMMVAAVVLWFAKSPRMLATISLIGIAASTHPMIFDFDNRSFERLFYGASSLSTPSSVRVDFHLLTVNTLSVMAALFLISLDAIWGQPTRRARRQEVEMDGVFLHARTAEILRNEIPQRGIAPAPEKTDVEILPPEKKD